MNPSTRTAPTNQVYQQPNEFASMVVESNSGGYSKEVRLPEIVTKAAWWVRFTLISLWMIFAAYVMWSVIGFIFNAYLFTKR